MRLGAPARQRETQLDGFKSRALREKPPTQRHLYTTEWRDIEVGSGVGAEVLVIGDDEAVECERLLPRVPHAELAVKLHAGQCAAIVVAVAAQRGGR